MWVGVKHPDVTESEFQEKLTEIDDRLSNEAAKLVESNADLITALAVFFIVNGGEILQRLAGAKVQQGRKQEGPRYWGLLACRVSFLRGSVQRRF